MADLKLKLKEAAEKTFSVPTNQSHTLTLTPPKVHVLDAEDAHFNSGRSVLLPDLKQADGSPPTLDARRVTGLGVLYAALVHAKANASQGLFVTGHADGTGSAGHNLGMSEDRAKGVSLLLRGKREEWAELAAKKDAVDDYQTVLSWQNQRAGWECDPGAIDNKLTKRTKAAIKKFQEAYNAQVDYTDEKKLDAPFKKKIDPDGVVGKETWGAIYDVYMSELMELFETEKYAEIQQLQQALKPPPGMPDFVGCGKNIAFKAARRDPFEQKDEKLEDPKKSPGDRRVEIMFFDPGEEVSLDCHPAPGQCKPAECPVYIKVPHRQQPIGIPKGLSIAEVNLKLTFVDPEGKVRPFPAGVAVTAKFGTPPNDPPPKPALTAEDMGIEPEEDAGEEPAAKEPEAESEPQEEDPLAVPQEPSALTTEGGLLQFVIPRKARSLYLELSAGSDGYVSCDPKVLEDQKLVPYQDAADGVAKGRVFFKLPEAFHTKRGYFELPTPGGVSFKEGAFLDVDVKKTQLGTRAAPLELRLAMKWQYFSFEYFDRFTMSLTQVAQTRANADGSPGPAPLCLMGAGMLVDAGNHERPPLLAYSAWHIQRDKTHVHCLGWPARETIEGKDVRALPDAKCTAMFECANLYVRTEGDGSSPDAERTFVAFSASDKAPNTPGVDRLRLYDLPGEWRSRFYPARFGGETIDKAKAFEELDPSGSALGKPYVFSLDTIVLDDAAVTWDDSKVEHRFTILDNQLKVYKAEPDSGESYFTRLSELKPQPKGLIIVDHAPFTRLIARGSSIYDVFDRRTPSTPGLKDAPVGARLAKYLNTDELPMTLYARPFVVPRADGTRSGTELGSAFGALLRCCGHEKGVELFVFLQHTCVTFDFDFKITPDVLKSNPLLRTAKELKKRPSGADNLAAECLKKIAKRWTGGDSTNKVETTYEIDAPEKAKGRYVALLTRGNKKGLPSDGEILVHMFASGRAFMHGSVGYWHMDHFSEKARGYFVPAHETGHIFGEPDEYHNTDYEPAYGQPHITDGARSPGSPYGFDDDGMMVGNIKVRARYFWEHLLFARDKKHFSEATKFTVKRDSVAFSCELTKLKETRVRFPLPTSKQKASLGTLGQADVFVYVSGRDEFSGKDIDRAAGARPYDGFVVVRVKMAWNMKNTNQFDELSQLLQRANDAIVDEFNKNHLVAVSAKYQGRSVRLRVLFAPRFICWTAPAGDGSEAYLKGIAYPALTLPPKGATDEQALIKKAYQERVGKSVNAFGVHLNVSLEDGEPGVRVVSGKRQAIVREGGGFLSIFGISHFDDDVIASFRQMVGMPAEGAFTQAELKPLLTALPPELTGATIEVV